MTVPDEGESGAAMDPSKLTVTPVARDEEPRFRELMDEQHYLGAPSKIGQTVWYAADNGRTVTADALLAQAAAFACLHGRGVHFMFVAKGNQKNLLKEIRGHFASQSPRPADFATRSPQPEHGRIEQREIRVSTDPVHWISFPWVGQVFMIKRTAKRVPMRAERKARGARQAERRDRLRHHEPHAGAEALLGFNRAHWSCERVHRIFDDAATWNEDRCRVRSGHGPENPAASGDWRSASSSGAASRSRRRSGT